MDRIVEQVCCSGQGRGEMLTCLGETCIDLVALISTSETSSSRSSLLGIGDMTLCGEMRLVEDWTSCSCSEKVWD